MKIIIWSKECSGTLSNAITDKALYAVNIDSSVDIDDVERIVRAAAECGGHDLQMHRQEHSSDVIVDLVHELECMLIDLDTTPQTSSARQSIANARTYLAIAAICKD